MGGGGGFSEYTTFPARFVHKIPDSLSYEKAALVEPMSVAYHSLEVGHFEKGQTAIVAGAGPIGPDGLLRQHPFQDKFSLRAFFRAGDGQCLTEIIEMIVH